MPYRRPGETREVPTADGTLSITIRPDTLDLRIADRGITITDRSVVVQLGERSEQVAVVGAIVLARNVPYDDLSIWMELDAGVPMMRRVFGVSPPALLAPDAACARKRIDEAAVLIRAALARHADGVMRAVELGRGGESHRVLLLERPDRHLVFACRLFRGDARLAMTVFDGGRIAFEQAPGEIRIDTASAVGVGNEHLRFTTPRDVDLARLWLPRLAHEDRTELARRIAAVIARR
jgi:hypothetical protein